MASGRMPGFVLEPVMAREASEGALPTAVPVFVGYVRRLDARQRGVATRITRYAEFVRLFGDRTLGEEWRPWSAYAPAESLLQRGPFLERSVELYFLNGGGPCYVVPVGEPMEALRQLSNVEVHMEQGLPVAYEGNRPMPEVSVLPSLADFAGVPAIIERVAEITLVVPTDAILLPEADYFEMCRRFLAHCAHATNRFCIMDAGSSAPRAGNGSVQARKFSRNLGNQHLAYGAAYYPFLNMRGGGATGEVGEDDSRTGRLALASAAAAAAYGVTDGTRGIWKAPANLALTSVHSLDATLALREMGALYDPEDGKAVNVIRSIHGRGIYIWGARTLAGHDEEWRFINVRRLVSFVEASLRDRTQFAVFEPNNLRTWIVVKGMCESFLKGLWEAGGLAGGSKQDAFVVAVGLGETMTEADIKEGKLIITVHLAPKRPAEFITLSLFHQVQALGNQ